MTTSRLAYLCAITGATVGLDQATKALARAQLAARPPVALLGGVVRLAYSENAGAFMGLGSALPPQWRTLFFSIFSALLLVGTTAYVLTARDLTPTGVVAASLLVAGGLGNLIDRIAHRGRVTDFLNVGIGPVRTGVFNVADLAIVLGVVGLMLPLWRASQQ